MMLGLIYLWVTNKVILWFTRYFMSLIVVDWQFKTILHTQPIKIFRIATLVKDFNLCGPNVAFQNILIGCVCLIYVGQTWQFKIFWLIVYAKLFWSVNPQLLNSYFICNIYFHKLHYLHHRSHSLFLMPLFCYLYIFLTENASKLIVNLC